MTPTQRTIKYFKDRGYQVGIVEKYNSFIKIRQDLFGFIDLIAIGHGQTLAIQQTSGSHLAEHINKIQASDKLAECLNSDWIVLAVGWRKLKKKRGGKAYTWTPKIVRVYMDDLQEWYE